MIIWNSKLLTNKYYTVTIKTFQYITYSSKSHVLGRGGQIVIAPRYILTFNWICLEFIVTPKLMRRPHFKKKSWYILQINRQVVLIICLVKNRLKNVLINFKVMKIRFIRSWAISGANNLTLFFFICLKHILPYNLLHHFETILMTNAPFLKSFLIFLFILSTTHLFGLRIFICLLLS